MSEIPLTHIFPQIKGNSPTKQPVLYQLPESLDQIFKKLCHILNMDSNSSNQALKLLKHMGFESQTSLDLKNQEIHSWVQSFMICSLWISGRYSCKNGQGNGVSLSQLLRVGGLGCEDFFSSLTNFTAKLPEDQQKFVINEKQQLFENWDNLSSLFRTTQKIVNLTFGTTTPNKTISFSSSSFMGILWTIFLLLREIHNEKQNDKTLMTCTFFWLLSQFQETQPSTDFQKSIAFHFGIPFEKISFFYSSIFPQLFENEILGKIKNGTPDQIQSSLKEINKQYEMRLRNRSGEYDPRFLLDNLNQGDRISSSSQSSREGNFTEIMNKLMIGNINHINPAELGAYQVELREKFRSQLSTWPEPTEAQTQQLNFIMPTLSQKIQIQYTQMQNTLKEIGYDAIDDLIQPASKLYYHCLLSIINKEQTRLKNLDHLKNLLTHSVFHDSLFSCSVQIVLYAFGEEGAISFKKLIESFKIHPLQFSMIIQTFILEEYQLGIGLAIHLLVIDQNILDFQAWEDDYIYTQLTKDAAKNSVAPSPKRAFETVISPQPKNLAESGESSAQLQFFFRKLYYSIFKKLKTIDQILKTGDNISKVWNLIIDLLSQESKLRLLFQRHVDEFVCCCIYSTLHPNDAKITDFSMLKVLQQNKMKIEFDSTDPKRNFNSYFETTFYPKTRAIFQQQPLNQNHFTSPYPYFTNSSPISNLFPRNSGNQLLSPTFPHKNQTPHIQNLHGNDPQSERVVVAGERFSFGFIGKNQDDSSNQPETPLKSVVERLTYDDSPGKSVESLSPTQLRGSGKKTRGRGRGRGRGKSEREPSNEIEPNELGGNKREKLSPRENNVAE